MPALCPERLETIGAQRTLRKAVCPASGLAHLGLGFTLPGYCLQRSGEGGGRCIQK